MYRHHCRSSRVLRSTLYARGSGHFSVAGIAANLRDTDIKHNRVGVRKLAGAGKFSPGHCKSRADTSASIKVGGTWKGHAAMITRRIRGANRWLGAPAGWDPQKDGDCGHLAIRTQGDPQRGNGYCESAWEPTPAELALLNQGGSVVLRVMGWQPPVALYVEGTDEVARLEPVPEAVTGVTGATTECPKCTLGDMRLAHFCQHHDCPIRGYSPGRPPDASKG